MKDAVLITGGLGYVGGRIARTLAEQAEYSLRLGTRNPSTAKPEWLKSGSLVPLDMTRDDQISAACKDMGTVIHLAAVNEIESVKDPGNALIVNTLGTLKLLQAAEKAGVERFIYFSTAHVYGAPLAGIITEETLPRPVHPYAITHRAAEDFVLAVHARKAMVPLVLRLSNGFGAPIGPSVDRWTLLVNDLCRQAVTTRKLVLQSAGLQKRDFITLSDVGEAVRHFLRLNAGQYGDGLFNLGGERVMSVFEMTQLVAARCQAILGFAAPIFRADPSPGTPALGGSDLEFRIDKLKQTGFTLKGDATAEIDATLRFCSETLNVNKQ